ncbi:beta family protein [Terribacillus saccharophilus]|uniref:beta family protein n=1 Tax=Terribacillus saccharophilus TaxID=361277 RepID=UPI00398195C4
MYYPLLKNSNNEMRALRELKDESRNKLIPIIESKRIKRTNVQNWEASFRTLGKFLKERVKNTKFIYDFNCALEELGEEEPLTSSTTGENLVQHCLGKMQDEELDLIPCFQHDSPDWLIHAVLQSSYEEIAIRIRCHDFQESFNRFVVQKLMSDLESVSGNNEVTIILDFFDQPTTLRRLQNAIEDFSRIHHKEIVYLATACPDNASGADPHSLTMIGPRTEFSTFLELKVQYPDLRFGDYTTRLKGEVLTGFNHYNSYVKIFYSTETDYWIAKSKLIGDDGEFTFYEVCQELVDQDFYPGSDFSFGDGEIQKCADDKITIGDHQTPIAIGVNHHIETTIAQLSSFPPVLSTLER